MPAPKRKRDFVKVGNVKIAWTRFADGRTCLDLRKWREENSRPTFTDHAAALLEAQRIALELNAGGAASQTLSPADRASYDQARRDAAAYDLTVHAATAEWRQLRDKAKGSGRDLAELLGAGLLALQRPVHRVPIVAEELLRSSAPKDLHGRYRRGLESTLRHFAAAFPVDIAEITSGQIESYLLALNKGPRRRDNILKEVRALFRFAWRRRYLREEFTAAREVPMISHDGEDITFFTPEEITLLLEHVQEPWLPFLAIASFSGLRTEEICLSPEASKRKSPLLWEDFDWDDREITVRAQTAKTGVGRKPPILENLWQWLAPWRDRKATGPICTPRLRPDREIGNDGRILRVINRERQRAAAERDRERQRQHLPGLEPESERLDLLTWRNDGLRHSYGSYRMAILRDMGQLASEMGNSEAIIKRHYHNPRPKSQAAAYFAICPPALPDNVLHLPLGDQNAPPINPDTHPGKTVTDLSRSVAPFR